MNLIQTVVLLAFIAYNFADAKSDVAKELGKNRMWHKWDAAQVVTTYLALSYIAFGLTYYALITFASLLIMRFPIFNIMHNLMKGDRWDHLSEEGIDGFVKRLFKLKH